MSQTRFTYSKVSRERAKHRCQRAWRKNESSNCHELNESCKPCKLDLQTHRCVAKGPNTAVDVDDANMSHLIVTNLMSHENVKNSICIYTGVSRTGKTPLSTYLAQQFGYKMGNVSSHTMCMYEHTLTYRFPAQLTCPSHLLFLT